MGYITEPQLKRMVAPMMEYECDGCQKRYKSRTASSMVHTINDGNLYLCSGVCLLRAIVEGYGRADILSFSVANVDYPEVIEYIVHNRPSRMDII
jgi:hypothetical protein